MLTPYQVDLRPALDFPQEGVPLSGLGPELRRCHRHGIDLAAQGFAHRRQQPGEFSARDLANNHQIDVTGWALRSPGVGAEKERQLNRAALLLKVPPEEVPQADGLDQKRLDLREDRGLAVRLEVLPVALGGGRKKAGAFQPCKLSLGRAERLMSEGGNFAQIPPVGGVKQKKLQDLDPGPRSDEGAEGWIRSYTFCSHTYTEYIRGEGCCQGGRSEWQLGAGPDFCYVNELADSCLYYSAFNLTK